MKRCTQYILAATLVMGATAAEANLIKNGGFEEGTFGDGSVRIVAPGDPALPGWTVKDNPLAWYTTGYEPNPSNGIGVGPHGGALAINMCDGSVAVLCDGSVRPVSISQEFAGLPSIEQRVSFWVGNYSGAGGPVSIGVTIVDGTSNTIVLSEVATAPATDLDSSWRQFTYSFISDGRSNTIIFSEIGGARYAGLDDVTVAGVPEPSTWALALLGFAGLALLGARRATPRPA